MNTDQTNYKEQGLVKSILTSEVKFIIGIVTVVLGVVAPYYSMRQDIALIKANIDNINANHEVHIQDITQNIKDLQTTLSTQQQQIIELQKSIIALQGHR